MPKRRGRIGENISFVRERCRSREGELNLYEAREVCTVDSYLKRADFASELVTLALDCRNVEKTFGVLKSAVGGDVTRPYFCGMSQRIFIAPSCYFFIQAGTGLLR